MLAVAPRGRPRRPAPRPPLRIALCAVLPAAAVRAGRTDREGSRGWLETEGRDRRHPADRGGAGPVAFDANADPKEKGFNVGVIQNGRIQLLGGQR